MWIQNGTGSHDGKEYGTYILLDGALKYSGNSSLFKEGIGKFQLTENLAPASIIDSTVSGSNTSQVVAQVTQFRVRAENQPVIVPLALYKVNEPQTSAHLSNWKGTVSQLNPEDTTQDQFGDLMDDMDDLI